MVSIGHSLTHGDARVMHVARIFAALCQTLPALREFYQDIYRVTPIDLSKPSEPHPRLYPYPSSFQKDGLEVKFTFVRALEDDAACVAFRARTEGADPQDIVVKFVSRYNADVHKFLADRELAPQLHYFDLLPGFMTSAVDRPQNFLPVMHMVVMDYVEHTCVPDNARKQLEDALRMLHDEQYVLGDLREPNILFDKSGKLKLIDFDWAGRYGKDADASLISNESFAHYPLGLSNDIRWPQGVRDLELIVPQHDLEMLDKFRPQ
jgi:hypothetical protein